MSTKFYQAMLAQEKDNLMKDEIDEEVQPELPADNNEQATANDEE